jgi:hypothetical protein
MRLCALGIRQSISRRLTKSLRDHRYSPAWLKLLVTLVISLFHDLTRALALGNDTMAILPQPFYADAQPEAVAPLLTRLTGIRNLFLSHSV